MTSKKHKRASDRVCEAIKKIERGSSQKLDIIVMIQGDEPMVTGKMIDKSLQPMIKNKKIKVVNLISPIKNKKELIDTNTIKVIPDKHENAIYFSRSVIPNKTVFKSNFFLNKYV